MELLRGITGFRHVRDPPLPVCDFAAFRGHCYTAARTLGGRVLSLEAPVRGIATNFARAVLELPGGRLAVLLNAHHPVIAFAVPPAEGEIHLRFIDIPALAEVFQSFGAYEVPADSELAMPLTPEACRQLAPAELEQVKYWEPRRLGRVSFNSWD